MDHISEEILDEYAFGRLPEAGAAPVEEHLLICAFCQERLQLTDEFIAALREAVAGRKRRGLSGPRRGRWKPRTTSSGTSRDRNWAC